MQSNTHIFYIFNKSHVPWAEIMKSLFLLPSPSPQQINRTKSNKTENSAVTLINLVVVSQACFIKSFQYFAIYIDISIHCKCCKLFSVNNITFLR